MRAVVEAVDCPVTMKMRLGWSEDELVYIDVARRAQAVGVRAVTLHARTAKQFYKGEADWAHIARLEARVEIPVIGNGDLDDPHLAIARMRESGVDAMMLGRATLGNPWLVSQIARSDGRPRRASVAARRRSGCVLPSSTIARWSRSWARRAPFRRCANTSALSQGHSGRGGVARAPDADRERGRGDRTIEATIARLESAALAGGVIEARDDLYGAASPQALASETYENYKRFVNPPLARVMKVSGSPGRGARARRDDLGSERESLSRFCRRLRRLYARAQPSARRRRGARAARADGALRQDDVQRDAGARVAPARRAGAGRSRDLVLVQQRNRGDRGSDQARARRDRTREDRRYASTHFTERRSARSRSAAAKRFSGPSARCSRTRSAFRSAS